MKASLVIDYYLGNKIFDIDDKKVNRDNCAYSIWLLKEEFKKHGVDLSTCDINLPEESDIVLYFDLPKETSILKENACLVQFECEVIKPSLWDIDRHDSYKKIFTWHDGFVDNDKYIKINFCHKFPASSEEFKSSLNAFKDKKLCTLISGNKKVQHELELYSEREKAILWFEENAASEFDFYGRDWSLFTSKYRHIRYIIKKIPRLSQLLSANYFCYKGEIENKKDILSKYKFSICYENAQLIPGYITEKIFDSFFSGCVPIYWGAPNVESHIPKNCYIDHRDFNSYEELYRYMNEMSENEYSIIQENIMDFIFSNKAGQFRAETFAKTIVEQVLNGK